MTTPRDIIDLALKDCGAVSVGQSPLAEDINDAFTSMNWMISQWNRKRYLKPYLLDKSVVSTGAVSYTVGPGGDIDMAVRPDKIESAYFRQLTQSPPNQVDYPLQLLQAREDYSRITLKQLKSFPDCIWYEASYPLGRIYPWPVPQATIYETHVLFQFVLEQFTNLSEVLALPEEYYPALHFNLCIRLGARYPVAQDQLRWTALNGMAKDSLNVIRGANTQIARLVMPAALSRPGIYNAYSDRIR